MKPFDDRQMKDAIRATLKTVIDPELGHNIVDLGMIYDISIAEAGAVTVVMTTTARFCPASAFLQQAVAEQASAVSGVVAVRVELTYDPPWTPNRMQPDLARHF